MSKDGSEIRRRRECEGCERRFTTYERIEESMPLVIKSDGRREPFDRTKIERGLQAAVAKRPVSRDQVADARARGRARDRRARRQRDRGARRSASACCRKLRALDQVAYVRFASIYRDFRDLEGFEKELDALRSEDTGRHELAAISAAERDAPDERRPTSTADVPPTERAG